MSILWKTYLVALSGMLTGIGILTVTLSGQESRHLVEQLRTEQRLRATIAAAQVEAGYHEQVWPFEMLVMLSRQSECVGWKVADGAGHTVLSSDPLGPRGRTAPSSALPASPYGPVLVHSDDGTTETWVVPMRMRTEGRPWTFHLSYRGDEIRRHVRQLVWDNAIYAALLAAFLMPLSLAFTRRAIAPLAKLAAAADEIGAGNLNVALPPPRRDETGHLVRAFDAMLRGIRERDQTIQRQIQALEILNDELEARVLQRTEELHKSEQRFRRLAENVGEVLWVLDRQTGRFEYVSPAFERVWGRERREHGGDPAWLLATVHEEDRDVFRAAAERWLEGGKAEAEYRVVRPDGSVCWVWDRGFPICDAAGQVCGVAGIAVDLTLRREAERLDRERTHLQQAVRSMEQVLGVVAHELRTPLAGVRAISELLLSGEIRESADCHTLLKSMNEEVVRMAETISSLLEAARLNSGRARWSFSVFPLARVCQEATRSVAPTTDPARVRLVCRVEPGDLTMRGDENAVRRLLTNLLGNAARFTADGYIEVRVRSRLTPEKWVEIRVCDTGPGIPPETLKRLGEPFALNAGVVGPGHVRGTGLGLAICKGIAAAHGGRLVVESAPGCGTTVTVLLRADLPGPAETDGRSDRIEVVSSATSGEQR